jgi:Flp pilus assembly protein TadG
MANGRSWPAWRRCLRSRVGSRGERGAALVEFAIVLPLLALVLFGIIEFGIAYNDYISVRNGSREGTRLAVVDDVDNAPSCTINGVTVTPPAHPTTATDATNALVCKTKDRIGLSSSATKVKIDLPSGTNPGSPVKVCASRPVESVTGLLQPFLDGRTLVSRVTMRLERPPLFTAYTEPGGAC